MSDPMRYTMEQLVKALVEQTVAETTCYDYHIKEGIRPAGDNAIEIAEKLYHLLKGLRVDSDQVQDVLDRMRAELDKYSFEPAKTTLLNAIRTIVQNKYKDDPTSIVLIITKALE